VQCTAVTKKEKNQTILGNSPEPADAAGFDFLAGVMSSGPESESESLARLLGRFFSNFGIFYFGRSVLWEGGTAMVGK